MRHSGHTVLLQLDRVELVYVMPEVSPAQIVISAMSALMLLRQYSCQWAGNSVDQDSGINSGAGAYETYLASCGPGQNGTLPEETQNAVCDGRIQIRSTLYPLRWGDGEWYTIPVLYQCD